MIRFHRAIAIICFVLLAMTSCKSSSWTTKCAPSPKTNTPTTQTDPAAPAIVQNVSLTAGRKDLDPAALKQIFAEIDQIGVNDPAGRERLMRDLQQSEPELWPLVMRQYRQSLAYRHQAEQRRLSINQTAPAPANDIPTPLPPPPVQPSAPPPLPPPPNTQAEIAPAPLPIEPEPIIPVTHYEPADEPKPMSWQDQLDAAIQNAASESSDPPKIAEAKTKLRSALAQVEAACPLTLKGLAFCTRIQSYGCVVKFGKDEFTAGQTVLLYGELENLSPEPTPQGFKTALRGEYRIQSADGRRVAVETLDTAEDVCANARRDCFVAYQLRLPEALEPGKYSLQLIVEDARGKKRAEASIPFAVTAPPVTPK